jgi:hypothetical protein
MSAPAAPITLSDVLARVPGRVNGTWRIVFALLAVAGVATFALTLAANPTRAWSAMLHSLTFWLVLSQAGVVLAGVMLITKARWAVPMQRIVLGTGSFLPFGYLLLLITIVFGARHLFPWVAEPIPQKAAYLNLPALYVRQIVLVGACMLVSLAFMRRTRRLDAGLARGRIADGLRARYEKWSGNWRGDAAEIADAQKALPRIAGLLVPLYAATYTVVCWDLVMSLDPHWATTMIGAWFFMGGILMAWASLSVLSLILRRAYRLEDLLTPDRYHQLGKLLFGFSIFWVYLFWSMFLPIWYANVPEESHWVVRRMREPFLPFSLAAIGLTWFVPFVGMMNLAAKRNPVSHFLFAVIVLAGLWIERLVLIYPSLYRVEMPLGVPEFGVTLGFLGGFALCYQAYAATHPLVALDQIDQLGSAH